MSTDIAEYDPEAAAEHERTAISADDRRTEAVGNALDSAYAKASTLVLTKEESDALVKDFPDDAFRKGAAGKDNLIYIEHAELRQRLNSVLGIGAVVPIKRREWTERYTFKDRKTGKDREAVDIYVEMVLLVRGCVVGESIGDATYFPDNAATSYSDALESAKSAAFRRCAKEFGVGLQAWRKGWVDGWWDRNPSGRPKPQTNGAPKAEPPVKDTAKFEPPKDWPDTEIHDIKLWVDTFTNIAQFKSALGLFLNEPSIVGTPADWEPILRHYCERYKATFKTKVPGVDEMNKVIKAALDKLEADKAEAAALDKEAAEASA